MKTSVKQVIVRVGVLISLLLGAPQTYAIPIAHLMLQSESGDYIGQGGTFDITYTPESSDFFFVNIFGSTLAIFSVACKAKLLKLL